MVSVEHRLTLRGRTGTAAEWTSVNPILGRGDLGYETDTGRIKVGDGTTAWASLDYRFETGGGGGAPSGAEYLVGALSGGLSAERLVTNTATITWDVATAGQVKASVPNDSIDTAKLGGDITAAGRALLDDADSSAQRTTLGLAAIAASGSASDLASGTVPLARISGITDAEIAAGNKDAVAGTASLRTLGTGAQQAAAGNHAHAQLHDAATVADTATINLSISGQQISGDTIQQMSITSDASGLKLVSDATSPGANKVYGTDGSGVKGWKADPSGSLTSTSVAFTDGDTVRRVTVTDAAVGATDKIVASIRRPDIADDSADAGHVYVANVVRVDAGSFDVVVACFDRGFGDTTEQPPNETVQLIWSRST